MKEIIITNNEAGQRVDKLLIKYLNKAPKSFIYKMIRKKNIVLNGKKLNGNEILSVNDHLKLFLSDETIASFQDVKKEYHTQKMHMPGLDIIYEDAHILLINKPCGVLSQKSKNTDVSLVEMTINYLLKTDQITQDSLAVFRPGVCNRLDRNTSGIVIAGKSLKGLQKMSELLKDRSVYKEYLCIVSGILTDKMSLEGYLKKDTNSNHVVIYQKPIKDSSYIKTTYYPVFHTEQYTLLRVHLETGRSHQIRAHLSSIGHPIIGDIKYGDQKINQLMQKKYHLKNQLLHSYRLEMPNMEDAFSYLSNKSFTAKLPSEFENILSSLFPGLYKKGDF